MDESQGSTPPRLWALQRSSLIAESCGFYLWPDHSNLGDFDFCPGEEGIFEYILLLGGKNSTVCRE
jgi:hypothetical protein